VVNAIMQAARSLAAQLSASECCVAYHAAKADISADPALMLKLDAYKKRHIAYRLTVQNGEPASLDVEKEIGSLYGELMLEPRTRAFLESERVLTEATADICQMLADACGVEPYFPNL